MAILKPDRIRTVKTPSGEKITIKEKIIPDGARATKKVASWCKKGEPMKPCAKLNNGTGKPKGVTIHNTNDIKVAKGTTPAEQYTRATWPNCNMGGAVVHFYVYKDEVWQNLRENEQGWHAGDGGTRKRSQRKNETIGGNLDTIAIECIGDIPESEETTAKLAAYLLAEYGLSPDTDLYTHLYFLPGKKCPKYILPHWNDFMGNVKGYSKAKQSAPVKTTGIKVGDTVAFKGGPVYSSSTAKKAASNRAKANCKVTIIAAGASHPYHCIGGGVYGWVDAESIGADKPAAPASKPAASAKIKAGDWILYTGRLYLTSYGGLPGKTVSGKFKADRVIEGRKYGIHIPGGWIEAAKVKKVK